MTKFLIPARIQNLEKIDDQNAIDDPRLKDIVHPFDTKQVTPTHRADIGIVGMPYDAGVVLSRGRPGTADAPGAIRRAIQKYGTTYNAVRNADLVELRIADCGDILTSWGMGADPYSTITQAVEYLLKRCGALITLGGSNDLSFGTIRGLRQGTGGMSIDAHLDVREYSLDLLDCWIKSGSPYRRLIDCDIVSGSNLFEVGIQGHVNSKHDWDWAEEQGMHIFTLDHVRQIQVWRVMTLFRKWIEDKKIPQAFVSIDIDSVAQAFAPGSSAPNPDGLFPQDVLEIAYTAGTMPQVRLFEIMEVNPLYDQDNRTARLAANIILEFLTGYTQRKTLR